MESRTAGGSAVIIRGGLGAAIDPVLENMARPEHEHTARQDRHLLSGLGVAAHTTPLLAHRKGSEATDFNRFSCLQRRAHAAQDALQEIAAFVPREPYLGMDHLSQ